MPRPSREGGTVRWNISLPATLALQIEVLTLDPVTQRPEYGTRSKIIQAALTEYIARRKEQYRHDQETATTQPENSSGR